MFNKKLKVCIMAACLTMAMSTSVFAVELLGNTNFAGGVGLPWTEVETAPAHADWEVSNNKYNITVMNNGINKWDVQLRHKQLVIEKDHVYTVQFTIESPVSCKVYAKIGEVGGAYAEYWNNNWTPFDIIAGVPLTVKQTFTMMKPTSSTAEFAFHMAGSLYNGTLPHKISFSNIHLDDPTFTGHVPPLPEPTNAIRVNQIGYAPYLEKVATLVSTSTTPVVWTLKNAAGNAVATGNTIVKAGVDHASGDAVHLIDFSSYRVSGKGYTLSVPAAAIDIKNLIPSVTGTPSATEIITDSLSTPDHTVSLPFDIGTDLYTTMKYDAIKYFYHSRSGVPIEEKYVQRPDLARLAGHNPDIVATDKTLFEAWYTPSYSKDITGGWYDAGDNGKYVVNGGITTWTMYNQYERALIKGDVKAFADNTMNIPESGNNIPDILDEARFNTELLLKMQIMPSESPEYAGMVHHKTGDVVWMELATRPDQDKLQRVLKPPTTVATLNMAAVAAQASRLWKQYDATFATKCLSAASTAWDAAVKHPTIYPPLTQGISGTDYNVIVTDEFYWAACELYVTTGDAKYLTYIKSSPKYLIMPTALTTGEDISSSAAFDSNNVAGLGTISLALVPNGLPDTDIATAKANIAKAADVFIATENREGYGSPIIESSQVGAEYAWGSNSIAINQAIVMGYAYEFTQNVKYLNGAATVMDYLLGRNPNVQSYITGYGDNPLENPYHHFWAYQVDKSFPKPPAGVLSGGPNSGLQDPWVKGMGWKAGSRPAQKCFTDNIQAWSTNEVAINWNAPLAWMAAFMDEKIDGLIDPIAPPIVIYGDVNRDGKINVIDYTLIKKYIAKTITALPTLSAADVNGDTLINIADMELVKQYLTHKIAKLPAQR